MKDIATIAYMAGLLDGEGCLLVEVNDTDRKRPSYYPRVTITQKDKRLLLWVQRNFGGKILENRYTYVWQWHCPISGLIPLLQSVLPYLTIKKEQASLMIALRYSIEEWKTKRYDDGSMQVPEDAYQFRKALAERIKELKKNDPEAIYLLSAGATTERLDSLKIARNNAQRAIYKEMRQSDLCTTEKAENATEMDASDSSSTSERQ